MHAWKELGTLDGDPRWVDLLERKLLLSGVKREDWWPEGGTHELTFALHLETLAATEWDPGCGTDRDTWKAAHGPEYLTGTIDYVGDWGTDVWIDDLKTGHWVTPAKTSKQLRSYALLPWVRAGAHLAYEIHVSITQWERYPLSGQPKRTWHTLTGLDLMEHLGDLRYAAAHPEEVNPSEDGCRWCECRPLCPAWVDTDVEIGTTVFTE